MTRPIIWALASFGAIAVAASVAGDRLAKVSTARPEGRSGASAPLVEPGGSGAAGRSVTVLGDRSGHFHVDVALDGRLLTMMVDTGASIVALSHEDAARIGIRPAPGDFRNRVATANGDVAVARVRIREMRLGSLVVRDVEAAILPAGRLGTSLLGMSFLRRLRGFDIAGNRLTLRG